MSVCRNRGALLAWEEHRARVESRKADIARFPTTPLDDVLQREYEPWRTERIVLDSAGEAPAKASRACFARSMTGAVTKFETPASPQNDPARKS
jgi:hypothetical protein